MSGQAAELSALGAWVGRRESRTDVLAPAPLAGLAAMLDRDEPAPETGAVLPPAAHWLYFHAPRRHSELGPDGHAKRGDFLPPVPLPRRMWAGGRIEFRADLRVGDVARRDSTIAKVDAKQGRSGPLVFVTVRHEIASPRGLAIVEEHDLVFREAPSPGSPHASPQPAPQGASWRRDITPDPVLLFRYSALTCNGHRIHYDLPYATGVEGYPGLVVHGPLLATLLLDLARRQVPPARMTRFGYRAVGALFAPEAFSVRGKPDGQGLVLWAEGKDGRLAMQGELALSR